MHIGVYDHHIWTGHETCVEVQGLMDEFPLAGTTLDDQAEEETEMTKVVNLYMHKRLRC